MAKKQGRKVKVAEAKTQVSEFSNVTIVNVLRVPRTDSAGVWLKSARGSLLMDTLCFPQEIAVSVKERSASDPSKWLLTIDDNDVDCKTARDLSIGTGSLKDTTTGIEYMLHDREGMDALPSDIKKQIIRRCKRITTIKRIKLVCKILDGLKEMQGIGDCFGEDEKIALFNSPAVLLNKFKDALNKVSVKANKPEYLSFSK